MTTTSCTTRGCANETANASGFCGPCRTRARRRDYAVAHIARTVLDLETIETRKSDRLDFHDLAVWSIRSALERAYDAGRASASSIA